MLPREPVAEIPSDMLGYVREMSEALQIIRNDRDPCCYSPFFSLTMQIPLPGIESKAKVL